MFTKKLTQKRESVTPKVRQRRTVQEQSKDQGTGDLREDKREEVYAGREQDTAKRITDGRRNDGNDRAEDHRAERIDEKAEVDRRRRGCDRDGDGLQRHADGDEDGRDGEHADLAELTGSVTPVGLGKRRGIQAGSERVSFQRPCPIPPLRNDGRAAARRPRVNSLVDIKNSSLRNESVRTHPIAQGGKKDPATLRSVANAPSDKMEEVQYAMLSPECTGILLRRLR